MFVHFGRTDLLVSRLCQGTAFRHLPREEDDTSERVLRHALDVGVNFFDTAVAYGWGGAERLLGKVVAGRRDRVVICSKIPAMYPPDGPDAKPAPAVFTLTYLAEQLDASLRRLRTDYLDLLFLHQPDTVTPVLELADRMATLVRSGKVRYWGVSNFPASEVATLLDTCAEGFAGTEDSYTIAGAELDDQGRSLPRLLEDELFPLIRQHGFGLVAFSPMDTGYLVPGRVVESGSPLADLISAIDAVAQELGVTRAQVCVAWVLSHPEVSCVLAGSESPAHVEENLAGTRLALPEHAVMRLTEASRRFRAEIERRAAT